MTNSMTDQATDTARTARNARLLASVLDALPEGIETPTHAQLWTHDTEPSIDWLIWTDKDSDQKARTAAIIRAVGGKWDKRGTGDLYRFETHINGVDLNVVVQREQVCERVVTGTREVTKTVPAPDAPTVEITETVEDVEWICAPLLAEVSA